MALTQSQEVVLFKLQEFKKQHFPKLTDGLAFMQFATSLALKGFHLTEADIQAGVTEGTNDGGIDGFHIIVNKTEAVSDTTRGLSSTAPPAGLQKGVPFDVVVVQAKSSPDTSLDTEAIHKLHEALNCILDPSNSLAKLRAFPLNDQVLRQVDAYRRYRKKLISLDPARSFTVYLMQPVEQTHITGPDRRAADALKKLISGYLGSTTTVKVEILSADGIETLRRLPEDTDGTLQFSRFPLEETHGKSQALLGLVTVRDFLSFIRRGRTDVLRDEFFSTNVRDFAGITNRVNDAIRASLSTDSSTAFWWMNNGITILADGASYQSDNVYLLSNPQIVNGLQTSNVIHEASLVGQITRKRLKDGLLVRVVSGLDPEVRDNIIRGTNNQTPVGGVQLFANDPLQMRIEAYLETQGWFYERRRWQFRGRKVSRSRIRSFGELAQAVISVLLREPDTARARPQTKLSSEADYRKVFDPTTPVELYSKLLDLSEIVEEYLHTSASKAIADDPLNDRYYLLTGVALRIAGVTQESAATAVVLRNRLQNPDIKVIEEVHKRLYSVVAAQPNAGTIDRLFKGSALRTAFLADIISWNIASPLKR